MTVLFSCLLLLGSDPASAESNPQLVGEWGVRDVSMNGKTLEDRELSQSVIIFRDGQMVMKNKNGKVKEVFKIKYEGKSSPPAYHAERVVPPARPQKGWFLYEQKEDTLRLTFTDALKTRPTSFDPKPNQILLTLKQLKPDPR
ncbi:hypothetical protein K2X85_13755 [bacterium]|nr:hypothetical protein [bacterium]